MKKHLLYCLALSLSLCGGCAGRQTRETAPSPPRQIISRETSRTTHGEDRSPLYHHPDDTGVSSPIAPEPYMPGGSFQPPVAPPPVTPGLPPEVYTFETEFGNSSRNRVNNIRTAARKLNGAVILPGEEFSFNHRVGARTVKAGYNVAPIIIQGKKEKGVGGGVCQVSTTLYNAALKAGFEITERHEHTREVGYVEPGQDATVSYGHADLKLLNTTSRPFVISCSASGNSLRVTLTEQA